MALPKTALARHHSVSATFGILAMGATDWAAPAPVATWTARDVVGHLVEWFPGFLAAGGVDLAPGPHAADDPSAAWEHQTSAVRALLTERGADSFTHPYVGTHLLADAVDRFYTTDVFMHSWDQLIGFIGRDPAWAPGGA